MVVFYHFQEKKRSDLLFFFLLLTGISFAELLPLSEPTWRLQISERIKAVEDHEYRLLT